MRRSSLSINNIKQNDYVQWSTLAPYEVDADGFVTAMLVYDGTSLTLSAYLRAEGAGDGSQESDWVLVEELTYVPGGSDCMGFMMYVYYVDTVNVIVKDAKLYKGKLFASEEPTTPPTEEPTAAPATKPATQPTTAPTEAPEAETAPEFPWGVVIGIAAAVVVIGIVVVIILKKKK